jgi:hypothetical protein
MSNDTRTLCQLPIGARVLTKTGKTFVIRSIDWVGREIVVQYTDNHSKDRLHLEAPVRYDQALQTWRMGRET